jgi:hypothetical protein
MPDIFISYSRLDAAAASSLANYFAVQGWSVWWDPAITVGQVYPREIESELRASRCVVVLWSPRSVQSDWVHAEASKGFARGVLIPVLIEESQPPLPFNVLQTIDLSDWESVATPAKLGLLLSAIELKLGSPNAPRLHVQSPVFEREDPEYRQATALFRDGHFVAALSSFRSVVRRNAANSEARYYLVLCALSGVRPKLLRTERVAEIEVHLREAFAAAKGDSAHIRYLWAIIRYDCYTFNGLREPAPTTQELLTEGIQLDSQRAREITSTISAPGNPVWESVFARQSFRPDEAESLGREAVQNSARRRRPSDHSTEEN